MTITWTPDVARLDSLDLWQHNPKQISKRRADRLLTGWQELGQFQTLAVGPDGECYDGHQRVKMLSQAGFPGDFVVAVLRASRPLTDSERRGVIMHSTLDTGQFDWDALAGWESAGWLDGYGFDAELLADWNTDAHNLSLMLEAQAAEIAPPEDVGPQVDRAEELRELWGVELGQVWEIPSKTADGVHRVICGDCTDRAVVDRVMGGEKAGAVVTDPPYDIGLTDWDSFDDIPGYLKTVSGFMGQNAFFAFFIQMPTMRDWINAVENHGLRYKDHIVWVKRLATGLALDLMRSHESLFIYRVGNPKYVETKGAYEDVKLPGVMFDTVSIEGIDRHIKDLRIKARGDTPSHSSTLKHNDAYSYYPSGGDRSPETANFTNVWSFLPQNQSERAQDDTIGHATSKPVLLVERLVSLLVKRGSVVLDTFLGSGTTLVACERQGRLGRGIEIAPGYVAVTLQRLADLGLEPQRVTR